MGSRRIAPAVGGPAVVAVALALAGCGGGSGGVKAEVTGTVTAYLHGILTGDGAEVCSHLTPQLRREQTAAIDRELGGRTLSCSAAFAKLSSLIPARERSKTVDVTQVTVRGDAATARIKGGTGTAHLVKQDGRWLLGVAPSAGG